MIIYFIRHGKPDYETDTLKPEGVEQAKACALRMKESGLDKIYSSPMGRAKETAKETAELLNLPVEILPWAYEIGHETYTEWPDGKLKKISAIPCTYWMRPEARKFGMEEFLQQGPVSEGFKERYAMITEGLDALLKKHGYERTEEGFYKCVHPNTDHIALFCHNAMMRAMISRLMNIPYQFLNCTMLGNYTGITAFDFEALPEGALLAPQVMCYADIGHLYAAGSGPQRNYDTGELF